DCTIGAHDRHREASVVEEDVDAAREHQPSARHAAVKAVNLLGDGFVALEYLLWAPDLRLFGEAPSEEIEAAEMVWFGKRREVHLQGFFDDRSFHRHDALAGIWVRPI